MPEQNLPDKDSASHYAPCAVNVGSHSQGRYIACGASECSPIHNPHDRERFEHFFAKPPVPPKVDDFWRRVDAIPKRYAFVVEEGGKVTYHGPFDSREVCEEYADNSDVNVTGFIEMQHPDDLIAAIEAKFSQ